MEEGQKMTNLSKDELAKMGRGAKAASAAAEYNQLSEARAAAQRKREAEKKAKAETEAKAEDAKPNIKMKECLDSHMADASRDPFAALNLLHTNTGLADNAWDPLFELKYCYLTPAQREEEIKLANASLRGEAAAILKEQPRVLRDYREASSEERIIYVCASCGEGNFKEIREYRLVSLAQLEPLRYSEGIAGVMARWERISRAHAKVEVESGKPYSAVFNYFIFPVFLTSSFFPL